MKNTDIAIEGVSLRELAETHGTPLYVYSAGELLKPLRSLQTLLHDLPHLVCFAVKACSNLSILKLLTEAGAGLDLVSGGELFRAGCIGAPGERLVFSGVGKTAHEMRSALAYDGDGIYSFHVESLEELQLLNQVARDLGRVAPIAFRFNPDIRAKTHAYISTGLRKDKFGLTEAMLKQAFRELPRLSHVKFHGISIHIGSQLLSLDPLESALKRLKKVIMEIPPPLKKNLEFVDLGGGIGVPYQSTQKPIDLKRYVDLIMKHFGPKSGLPALKILLEPGRLIAARAGTLVSRVLYRKSNPQAGKEFLIIDAAMNDLIRPALYQGHHEIIPVKKNLSRKIAMDVVGPVCESGDFLAQNRKLPSSLQQGDLIAILNAGAYGFSMASHYNSRPKASEVLVQNGQARLIRRRETYDDLIQGELLE